MQFNPNAEILVLDEEGTNLGKMSYRDAKSIANSRNLDLIQINKNNDLQVYKIMDRGKWKYEQKKTKSKQKKPTHHLKEMNFKMRIDPHDMNIKIDRIKGFLEKGDDVKIAVVMRGRERSNPKLAHEKMDQILKAFGDKVQVQQRRSSSSMIFVTIRPNSGCKFLEDEDSKKPSTPSKDNDKEDPAVVRWIARPRRDEELEHASKQDDATAVD